MVEWKIIKDFENYEISNDGQVKNKKTGIIRKPFLDMNGYEMVDLYKNTYRKNFRIHRLVAIAFIPNNNPLNDSVDHIDRNKLNNHVNNLRWSSVSNNAMNSTKIKNSSSKYKGVSTYRKNWACSIMINKKNLKLGSFKTEIEAAFVYNYFASKHFQEFANLNSIGNYWNEDLINNRIVDIENKYNI